MEDETATTAPETAAAAPPEPAPKALTMDDVNAAIKAVMDDAAKKAAMSADERAAADAKTKEDDYAKRVAEVTRRELRADARGQLAEKCLDPGLLDVINYESAETVKTSIAALEVAVGAAVKNSNNNVMRGTPPTVAVKGGAKADNLAALKAKLGIKY